MVWLEKYTTNVTERVTKEPERYQAFEREEEIKRAKIILNQTFQNSVLLTSEPGVGKTAVVENLALELTDSENTMLQGKEILKLEIPELMNGSDEGTLEFRFKQLLKELTAQSFKYILFIDEFHEIMGTSSSESSAQDMANMLKPPLSRGEFQLIGATTTDEYHEFVEKDGALTRRLEEVHLNEPSLSSTKYILQKRRGIAEAAQQIVIPDESIDLIIRYAKRFMTSRYFPEKGLVLMDSAASTAKMNNNSSIEESDVAEVISNKFSIPMNILLEDDDIRVLRLKKTLKKKIKGQDEAIDTIFRRIATRRAGLGDASKPLTMMFPGPTGVGKTETAKQLATALYGSEENMIRFDMSEFKDGTEAVNRFKSLITQRVRKKPYALILLDEFEKSDPRVWDLLLQIFDDGRLSDDFNRTVNFKDATIILTTNAAQKEIDVRYSKSEEALADKKREGTFISRFKTALQSYEMRREFLDRIDEIVFFRPLEPRDEPIRAIVAGLLDKLNERTKNQGIQLLYKSKDLTKIYPDFSEGYEELEDGTQIPSHSIIEFLIDKGLDRKDGVRPMHAAVSEYVETPIAGEILSTRHGNHKQFNTLIFRAHGNAPTQTSNGDWYLAIDSMMDPNFEGGATDV